MSKTTFTKKNKKNKNRGRRNISLFLETQKIIEKRLHHRESISPTSFNQIKRDRL